MQLDNKRLGSCASQFLLLSVDERHSTDQNYKIYLNCGFYTDLSAALQRHEYLATYLLVGEIILISMIEAL
jgi:hypothetical protein